MAVPDLAKNISERMASEVDSVENIQSFVQGLKSHMGVTKENCDLMKMTAQRQDADYAQRFTNLESQIAELRSKHGELTTGLHRGQVARSFERSLARYIYPRGKNPHMYDDEIFPKLKKWLQENEETQDQEDMKAIQRWKNLAGNLGWSDRLEMVLSKMLEITNPRLADPNSSIPIGKINEDEKPLVEEIGKMTIKLKDLLKKLE